MEEENKKTKKPNGYWTFERCQEEAKRYSKRSHFERGSRSAFASAKQHGWINIFFPDTAKVYPRSHWTLSNCRNEASKYKTRSDFDKGSHGAYTVAKENGWLDEILPLMPKELKWSYDKCKAAAEQYLSRKELKEKDPKAYYACARLGILSEFFPPKIHPSGYWNYDNCKKEAVKYKRRVDFKRGCREGYNKSVKMGWINDFIPEKQESKPAGFWTYDKCKEEAGKYERRINFEQGNSPAYRRSIAEGWIDEFFPDKRETIPSSFWDYNTCLEESKHYKNRSDFNNNSNSAYLKSLNEGWIDDFTWLLPDDKDPIFNVYVYIFDDKFFYVGMTKRKKQRDWDHRHKGSPVYEHSIETGLPIPDPIYLAENLVITEAQKMEGYYLDEYKSKEGYTAINKAKAGLGASPFGRPSPLKWTYEACAEEAKKYTNIASFEKNVPGAYSACRRYGWLNDFFEPTDYRPSGYWTEERCRELVMSCNSRVEVNNKSRYVYYLCLKKGWLDKWMPKNKK